MDIVLVCNGCLVIMGVSVDSNHLVVPIIYFSPSIDNSVDDYHDDFHGKRPFFAIAGDAGPSPSDGLTDHRDQWMGKPAVNSGTEWMG